MSNRRLMGPPPTGGGLTTSIGGSDHFDVEKAAELALLEYGQNISIAQLARVLEGSGMGRDQARNMARDYFKKVATHTTAQIDLRVFLLKYVMSQVFVTARAMQSTQPVSRAHVTAALAERIGPGSAALEVQMYMKGIDASNADEISPEQLSSWHSWKKSQIERATTSDKEEATTPQSEAATPQLPKTKRKQTASRRRRKAPTPPQSDKEEVELSPRTRARQTYPSITIITDFVAWEGNDREQENKSKEPVEIREYAHSFKKGPLKLGKLARAIFKKKELSGVKILGLRRSIFNDALYTPKPLPEENKTRRQKRLEATAKSNSSVTKLKYARQVRQLMHDSVANADRLAQMFNDKVKYKKTKDGAFVTDTPAFINVLEFAPDGSLEYSDATKEHLEDGAIYELVMDNARQRLLRGITTVQGRTWNEEWAAIATNGEQSVPYDAVVSYYKKEEEKKEDVLREMFGSEVEKIRTEMVEIRDFNEILLELFYRTNVDNKGIISYEQFMFTQAQANEHVHLERKALTLPTTTYPFHSIEPKNSKKAITVEKKVEPPPSPPEEKKDTKKEKKKSSKKKKSGKKGKKKK